MYLGIATQYSILNALCTANLKRSCVYYMSNKAAAHDDDCYFGICWNMFMFFRSIGDSIKSHNFDFKIHEINLFSVSFFLRLLFSLFFIFRLVVTHTHIMDMANKGKNLLSFMLIYFIRFVFFLYKKKKKKLLHLMVLGACGRFQCALFHHFFFLSVFPFCAKSL